VSGRLARAFRAWPGICRAALAGASSRPPHPVLVPLPRRAAQEVKWALMVASCYRRTGNLPAALAKYKQVGPPAGASMGA
jgi:hypothetical protein